MKPTPAQIKYLTSAYWQVAKYPGSYFSLWTHGHANTGKACLRRGWITPCSHAAFQPYGLTRSGVDIAEQAILARKPEGKP